jgi:hypothetical protein
MTPNPQDAPVEAPSKPPPRPDIERTPNREGADQPLPEIKRPLSDDVYPNDLERPDDKEQHPLGPTRRADETKPLPKRSGDMDRPEMDPPTEGEQ